MRKEENLELESQDKVKAFNPSTQEQRQADLKFKDRLIYRDTSQIARSTMRKTVFK